MAGRGYGKTRVLSEAVIDQALERPGCRIAIVAPTSGDVRAVCFEGDSGLLNCVPREMRDGYNSSLSEFTFPNGTLVKGYTAAEPNRLRGPQHHFAVADEPASWWAGTEAWDMLMFGLRLGTDPRVVAASTPKPVKLIRSLLADPTTLVTRGTSYDNRANLAPAFFDQIIRKYEGTRLGRQELMGELLEEFPGALWLRSRIDELRVQTHPGLLRVVVAIDPAVTSKEDSDETGIVVAGLGVNGHGYILADGSMRDTPNAWARRAIQLFGEHMADRIVGEANNGGDLIETVLRTIAPNISYRSVHASRGKTARAEPVAALFEQGRCHMVGTFDDLEDQLCAFTPDNVARNSPDRAEAMVWALTELMIDGGIQYTEQIEEEPMPRVTPYF